MAYQHTTPDKPARNPETQKGEELLSRRSGQGNNRLEDDATGINVDTRGPIDPRMPHMPPA